MAELSQSHLCVEAIRKQTYSRNTQGLHKHLNLRHTKLPAQRTKSHVKPKPEPNAVGRARSRANEVVLPLGLGIRKQTNARRDPGPESESARPFRYFTVLRRS